MYKREAQWWEIKRILLEVICHILLIGLMIGGFFGVLWLCSLLGA
jgi:hypothetical protein